MKIGDLIGPLVKPPITTRQLVMYAGASGDFNPIHYDHPFATAGGYPSVIAHGMLSMAFFGQLLAPYLVKRLSTRFRAVTYPGDVVTVSGEVVALHNDSNNDSDSATAELKLTARTQSGTVTLEGSATVRLK